jgi:hypothetical protein
MAGNQIHSSALRREQFGKSRQNLLLGHRLQFAESLDEASTI